MVVPTTQVGCNEEMQIEKLECSKGSISVLYYWVVKPDCVLQKSNSTSVEFVLGTKGFRRVKGLT